MAIRVLLYDKQRVSHELIEKLSRSKDGDIIGCTSDEMAHFQQIYADGEQFRNTFAQEIETIQKTAGAVVEEVSDIANRESATTKAAEERLGKIRAEVRAEADALFSRRKRLSAELVELEEALRVAREQTARETAPRAAEPRMDEDDGGLLPEVDDPAPEEEEHVPTTSEEMKETMEALRARPATQKTSPRGIKA